MKFAEALVSRDEATLTKSREALSAAAGSDVLVDAAGVAANFQHMVRIADSTGIPLDERNMSLSADVRGELNLERFGSAENSRQATWFDKTKGYLTRILFKILIRRMARQNQVH